MGFVHIALKKYYSSQENVHIVQLICNSSENTKHKFESHKINVKTKILILGTFHPNLENEADFFYGRSRNYLWRILPTIFEYKDLKRESRDEKNEFMNKFHIDFIDIVESINVNQEEKINYSDSFLDGRIIKWKEIKDEIDKLNDLEEVYFTRKTFIGIPNIEFKVSEIRNYCMSRGIRFCLLQTPARFSNAKKINSWKMTIKDKITCI